MKTTNIVWDKFIYEGEEFAFAFHIKPIKHIYIRLKPEGVVVSTSKKNLARAKALVQERRAWIKTHSPKQKRQDVFYYLGEYYKLDCIASSKNELILEQKSAKLFYKDVKQIEGIKEQFYKEAALTLLATRIEYFSEVTQLFAKNFKVRKAKRRFGSCSFDNRLSFNYFLLQYPLKCIDYVVLHELCHIKHKNHSKAFYALIKRYMPDYQQRVNVLHEYFN